MNKESEMVATMIETALDLVDNRDQSEAIALLGVSMTMLLRMSTKDTEQADLFEELVPQLRAGIQLSAYGQVAS